MPFGHFNGALVVSFQHYIKNTQEKDYGKK